MISNNMLAKINWPMLEKAFGVSMVTFAVAMVAYMMEGQPIFIDNPFASVEEGSPEYYEQTEVKED